MQKQIFHSCLTTTPSSVLDLNILGQDLGPDFLASMDNYLKNKEPADKWYAAAVSDGPDLVGTSGWYVEHDRYWLGWTGVLPRYRGKGYGKAILMAMEDSLRTEAETLHLYCGKDNQTFYEKSGYTVFKLPDGEQAKSQEGISEPGWDGVLMRKSLAEP